MFTLPIYDDNPRGGLALVTWLIVAACVLVFLWQFSLSARAEMAAIFGYGLVPAVLTGQADLPRGLPHVPAAASVVTSMFLHGGWMHLLGNMLYLWIFGDNVEDSMGHVRFAVFYLLCGAAAAATQVMANPASEVPMVGASGAIAGVLGAYLLLHPRANVGVLLVIIIYVRVVLVPAVLVLGLWFVMQLLSSAHTPTESGGVATWAHIGGFVAGMLLIPFFKRPQVRLFGHQHTRPFAMDRVTRSGHLPPPFGG